MIRRLALAAVCWFSLPLSAWAACNITGLAGITPAGGLTSTIIPGATNTNAAFSTQQDSGGNCITVFGQGLATATLNAWSASTTLGTTQVLMNGFGPPAIAVQLNQTATLTGGQVTFQETFDNATWVNVPPQNVINPSTGALIANPYSFAVGNQPIIILTTGAWGVRMNLSTIIPSGNTGTVTPNVATIWASPYQNTTQWNGVVVSPALTLADNMSNPTEPLIGAANAGWDTASAFWRRNWVIPGTGIQSVGLVDDAGQPLYDKPTYRISGGPVSTFGATTTDWITVTGSATKTVRITNIMLCGIATTSTSVIVQVIKRSTVDTGGTSTALTFLPEDANNTSATATGAIYTVNPTALGTTVGNHDVFYLNLNPTGSAGCISNDIGTRNGQALVLRGTTQQIAINFNSTAPPAGANLTYRIEETEGAATD